MTNDLISKIEAVLFYLAEPVSVGFLSKTLDVKELELKSALNELKDNLGARGIRILIHEDEVSLVTAPELSEVIEKIIKEERERDLGRAGIETLAIIAYKGFVSKKEVEFIRGVNSQYALRNLLLRGLIERKENKDEGRLIGYSITGDTLRYLGLTSISDLPQFNEMQKALEVKEDEDSQEVSEIE